MALDMADPLSPELSASVKCEKYTKLFHLGGQLVLSSDFEAREGVKMEPHAFRDLYKHKQVHAVGGKALLSFVDNRIYLDGEEVHAGLNALDKAHPCCAGRVCCLADDGGMLTTIVLP